jgi:hypothetical protein
MEIFDSYIPFLHSDADLFVMEYNAQPRSLVDPREAALSAPSAPLVDTPQASRSSTADTSSVAGSCTTTHTTIVGIGHTNANADYGRILAMLEQQQRNIGALTQMWGVSALAGVSSQIFIIKDMLGRATEELQAVADLYPGDQDHEQVVHAQSRVHSLTTKLAELDAEHARMSCLTSSMPGTVSTSHK